MKNPILQFILWAVFLSYPAHAQEAIQIEIDSAPVEVDIREKPFQIEIDSAPVVVDIQKPVAPELATPASQETSVQQTAEAPEPAKPEEITADSSLSRGQTIGIAIGAAVAAGLALIAGGGGGGGGGNSTPSHP